MPCGSRGTATVAVLVRVATERECCHAEAVRPKQPQEHRVLGQPSEHANAARALRRRGSNRLQQ